MSSVIPLHIQKIIDRIEAECKTSEVIGGLYKGCMRDNVLTAHCDKEGRRIKQVFCDGIVFWSEPISGTHNGTDKVCPPDNAINTIWLNPSDGSVAHISLINGYKQYKKAQVLTIYKDSKPVKEELVWSFP